MKKNILLVLLATISSVANAIDMPGAKDAKAGDIGRHETNSGVSEWMTPENGVYGLHVFAADESDWDSQFFIVFADQVVPKGTIVSVKFEYRKAENSGIVKFSAQGLADPGSYVNNDGWMTIEASEKWQTFENDIITTGEIRTFGVNCSIAREDGTLYLRNIDIAVDYESIIETKETADDYALIEDARTIVKPEPAEPSATVPYSQLNTSDDTTFAALAKSYFVGYEKNGRLDGKQFVAHTSRYNGEDNVFAFNVNTEDRGGWETEFFAYFDLESEPITVTKNVTISFDYKTDFDGAGSFSQTNGNNMYAKWGVIPTSMDWQTWRDTLSAEQVNSTYGGSLKFFEYQLGAWNPKYNYNVFLKNVVVKVDDVIVASSNDLTPIADAEIVDYGRIKTNGLIYQGLINNTAILVGYDIEEDIKNLIIPTSITAFDRDFSVTAISNDAFINCNSLTTIKIPNSVTTIGSGTFYGCNKVTSITTDSDADLSNADLSFIKDGIRYKVLNKQSVAVVENPYSGELVLPDSVSVGNTFTVKHINSLAFKNCKELSSITIPNTITSIGNFAFYGCVGLKTILIPNSVLNIGNNAFEGCVGVESVVIGNGVKKIEYGAFEKCNSLNNVVCLSDIPPTMNSDVFSNGDSIYVMPNCVNTYKSAPIWKDKYIVPINVSESDTAGTVYDAKIFCMAEPKDGYHFLMWSDSITENRRWRSVSDTSLVALFEAHTIAIDSAIAATCTKSGLTEGSRCSVCNVVFATQDTIPALGHKEVIDAAEGATCTESGKTEGSHCSVCGEVFVAQTEIPALGHEFVNYVYNNDATTEADGTKTAVCEHGCGTTDTRVAEGTKLSKDNTAVSESAADKLLVYSHGNTIVVENATEEILVYDAMGRLVGREVARNISTITVKSSGVYIVKTGNEVKRVMIK